MQGGAYRPRSVHNGLTRIHFPKIGTPRKTCQSEIVQQRPNDEDASNYDIKMPLAGDRRRSNVK